MAGMSAAALYSTGAPPKQNSMGQQARGNEKEEMRGPVRAGVALGNQARQGEASGHVEGSGWGKSTLGKR